MPRIFITGYGVVCAIGNNRKECLDSLLAGRTGVGKMQYLNTLHRELPVGEVKMSDEEMVEKLGLDPSKPWVRTSLMGIWALKEALEQSGISAFRSCCHDDSSMTNSGTVQTPDSDGKAAAYGFPLINGTTVGGMDRSERYYRHHIEDDSKNEYIKCHDCGAVSYMIAGAFDCFNMVSTPSTACSSAMNSIIRGAEMILDGEASIVAAGGSESLSSFHTNGFNSLMILDKELCRPFDKTRSGLNLGEGAAYFILESEESVKKRGVKPLAELKGFANTCDAFHQTASSEDGEGAYLAMKEALESASIAPEQIDWIKAHGTGTPNNDASETVSIRRLFGDNHPPVSSTKAFTGHTTSASGSIEAAFGLLAIENQFIPESLNWKESDGDTLAPYTGKGHRKVKNVLCNAFGFGGNDSSLLLSAIDEETFDGVAFDGVSISISHDNKCTRDGKHIDTECQSYVEPSDNGRDRK